MGTVSKMQPQPRQPRDPAGRPPVRDDLAERSILSAVLDDSGDHHSTAADRVVEILRHDHFFDPRHREIWTAVEALYNAGAIVTWLSVINWLKDRDLLEKAGGEKYLFDELPKGRTVTAHLEVDATRIRDLWRQRQAVEIAHRIVAEGYDRQPNVQDWLEQSQRTFELIAAPPETGSAVTMGEALREVFGEMEASAARGEGITGIPTGYDDLDHILGGWHGQELTILGGRPGMGKSAGGMAFALNAASAKPRDGLLNGVGFFSVEMTRPQLASRTICSMAGVNYMKVQRKCLQPADWHALTHAAAWMSALPLWIDDYAGLTPAILRSKCRRLKARAEQSGKARLSLVVVDYLQRMKSGLPPDARKSRQEEVAYISWSLKELSKELNVPVIALAQVNRASQKGEDKRPKLSDLREAGDIEQDADNVIFIHREAYYLKDKTPEEWKDVAEFIVEKQRNGPTDTAFVRFIKDSAKFVNEPGLGQALRGGYH